jgi:hypothetical protein
MNTIIKGRTEIAIDLLKQYNCELLNAAIY